MVGKPGRLDRVVERLRKPVATPTVVADPRPHAHRVLDCGDGVDSISRPRGAEELQRHDAHVPVHARNADGVVADRTDGAGHMGAVAVVVHRRALSIEEIVPIDVVHVTVAVVVYAVLRDFAGVHPEVVNQVGMGRIDTRVDDRDRDVARADAAFPRLRRADIGARQTAELPGVAHSPEQVEIGIVRHQFRSRDHIVGFGVEHLFAGPVGCQHLGDPRLLHFDLLQRNEGVRTRQARSHLLVNLLHRRRRDAGLEAHQQAPFAARKLQRLGHAALRDLPQRLRRRSGSEGAAQFAIGRAVAGEDRRRRRRAVGERHLVDVADKAVLHAADVGPAADRRLDPDRHRTGDRRIVARHVDAVAADRHAVDVEPHDARHVVEGAGEMRPGVQRDGDVAGGIGLRRAADQPFDPVRLHVPHVRHGGAAERLNAQFIVQRLGAGQSGHGAPDDHMAAVYSGGVHPRAERPAGHGVFGQRRQQDAAGAVEGGRAHRDLRPPLGRRHRDRVLQRDARVAHRPAVLRPLVRGSALDLQQVVQAVAVRVGHPRVGPEPLILHERQPEAVRAVAIVDPVAIGVGRVRIGAPPELVEVDEAVAVLVAIGVADAVKRFPPVRQPVGVAVVDPGEHLCGGAEPQRMALGVQPDAVVGRRDRIAPVAGMREILGQRTAVVEAVVADHPRVASRADQPVGAFADLERRERGIPHADVVHQRPGRPAAGSAPDHQRPEVGDRYVVRREGRMDGRREAEDRKRVHRQQQFLFRGVPGRGQVGPLAGGDLRGGGGGKPHRQAARRLVAHKGNAAFQPESERLAETGQLADQNARLRRVRRPHPGLHRPILQRDRRVGGHLRHLDAACRHEAQVEAAADAIETPHAEERAAPRAPRTFGQFALIRPPVIVRVGFAGVAPPRLLVAVAQAVAVGILLVVPHAVVVRITPQRVGSREVFVEVGEAVAIGVGLRRPVAGQRRIERGPVQPLPGVGNRVAVAVLVVAEERHKPGERAGHGGAALQHARVGPVLQPVFGNREVLGRFAAVVEAVVECQPAERQSRENRRQRARVPSGRHRLAVRFHILDGRCHRPAGKGHVGAREHPLADGIGGARPIPDPDLVDIPGPRFADARELGTDPVRHRAAGKDGVGLAHAVDIQQQEAGRLVEGRRQMVPDLRFEPLPRRHTGDLVVGARVRRVGGGRHAGVGAVPAADRRLDAHPEILLPDADLAPDHGARARAGVQTHPGFHGVGGQRQPRRGGTQRDRQIAAAVQLQHPLRAGRGRIGGIAPPRVLVAVGQAVVVGVGHVGQGPLGQLEAVHQAVAVAVFVAVENAVVVRVGVQRIGVAPVLQQVGQAVAVGIGAGVGKGAEPHLLPPVRDGVVIGVAVARHGGERGVGHGHIAQRIRPVQGVGEVLGREATVVEAVEGRQQFLSLRLAGALGSRGAEAEVAQEDGAVVDRIQGIRHDQLERVLAGWQRLAGHQQRRQAVVLQRQRHRELALLGRIARRPRVVVDFEEVVVDRQRLSRDIERDVGAVEEGGKRVVERADEFGKLLGREQQVEGDSINGVVDREVDRQRRCIVGGGADQGLQIGVARQAEVRRCSRREVAGGRVLHPSRCEDDSVPRSRHAVGQRGEVGVRPPRVRGAAEGHHQIGDPRRHGLAQEGVPEHRRAGSGGDGERERRARPGNRQRLCIDLDLVDPPLDAAADHGDAAAGRARLARGLRHVGDAVHKEGERVGGGIPHTRQARPFPGRQRVAGGAGEVAHARRRGELQHRLVVLQPQGEGHPPASGGARQQCPGLGGRGRLDPALDRPGGEVETIGSPPDHPRNDCLAAVQHHAPRDQRTQ